MSTAQKRLNYLTERNSLSDVSEMSGIGESVLRSLADVDTALSHTQDLSLRAAYQREAYDRMQDAGFSVSQAERFRWYSPDTAREHEASVREKIEYLSQGAYASMASRLEREGEDYDPEELYYDAYETVYEGFQHSKEPYEKWMDY